MDEDACATTIFIHTISYHRELIERLEGLKWNKDKAAIIEVNRMNQQFLKMVTIKDACKEMKEKHRNKD